LKNHVDLLDNVVFFSVGDELLGAPFVVEIAKVEPGVESLPILEDVGHQEIQKRPQLFQAILERRASD
jgi:hypothetical protein